ncbi:Flp pilus assembly protein CpaB [Bacillus sp. es.034]|uniref:Flp pilus assembly protein CpaB n=1 Tax=Bacillus sp. es.034 TaxID=1761763 RepID=UPI000BF902BB|nr:Flp pilus assembly protein CpaB [Bacillus sp. es.034]PFG04595.1 Flp pilus assembly protein CpaB [Bacillus sp. es.034]
MKTKRIWMWSFVFGIIAALVAYIVVIPAPAPVPASTTTAVKDDGKEKQDEKEPEVPSREMNNKMIPVAEGMRAISLKVALEQGVSGYIEPNSHIDIIAFESTIDGKTKKEMRTANVLLQNVKVLTSGKSADGPDEALRYETVTVEVTPAQGAELSLASKDKDGFYFMLRGKEDTKLEKDPISFSREVFKEGESEE